MPGATQPAWKQYSFAHRTASIKASRIPHQQTSAVRLPQDVLKRILGYATSSLPLDRQQVDVLTPFGRVCRDWRRAAAPWRVLRITNRGQRVDWTPEQQVLQAVRSTTRLCLDVVHADRFGIPLPHETERLVKLVLLHCDRLRQLRISVASLPPDVFGSLRFSELDRLEIYGSPPSLRLRLPIAPDTTEVLSARPIVATTGPRQISVESCLAHAYISRLDRIGIFENMTRLEVTVRAGRPVLEDLNLSSFGPVGLDHLELRFDDRLRYDYHATKFRERLFLAAFRLRPQRLVVNLPADAALADLAKVVSLAPPARLSTLSVKGLASARTSGSRLQVDVLEVQAGRHLKGKALRTIVTGAGAPPSLYRVVHIVSK